MKETYKEIFGEVMDEIESSLKDSRGIIAHQRRLAFSLSFGMVNLLESYLDKLNVLKPGAKINHLWLKKKKENAKKLISSQITSQIGSIENIDKILDVAFKIESERNELVYGKKVSEDILNKKINLFLDLKKELEND
ncbi:MAG: hypothetical protein AABX50_01670 [Nanoarchaeota archaeon]